VFEVKKALLRRSILEEQYKEEVDLYEKLRAQFRPGTEGISHDWKDIHSAYDEQVLPIREKYEQQLNYETEQLVNDYTMRCNRQNAIARSIARLSPVNIVSSLMAEFSDTGYSGVANFMQQAAVYQEHVKRDYYDKMPLKIYREKNGMSSGYYGGREDWPKELPTLENYKNASIGQIFQQNWVDIALLGFYGLLFFLCSFVSFLRFDVR